MATVDLITTQVNTFFNDAASALHDAQIELSAQLMSAFTTSYAAVDTPSISDTIIDISGAATSITPATFTTSGTYTKADITIISGIQSALDSYTSALQAITAVPLIEPDLTLYQTNPQWNETYWSNVKTRLEAFTADILSSSSVDDTITALTSDSTKVQIALYEADQERKQQALRDVYSAANAKTGARGFSYPNSMTTALKIDAQQKYQFDLSQTARDLIKLVFEWAKTDYQFALGKQIDAHVADTDFNTRFASVMIQFFSEQVKHQLEIFRNEVLRISTYVDANVKLLSATLDEAKINLAVDETKDRLALGGAELEQRGIDIKANVAKASASYTIEHNARQIAAAAMAADQNFKLYTTSISAAIDAYRTRIGAAQSAVTSAASLATSASASAIGIING